MSVRSASESDHHRGVGQAPDVVGDAFRRWGYLKANLDPLGRITPQEHPDITDVRELAHAEELARWESIYSGPIGFEFMHMVERERVVWLRDRIEAGPPAVDEPWILERIVEAELFERFLHSRYVGSKRFSLDGVAGLIPLLDALLHTGARLGAEYGYLAMSHRGRLTVLKNVVNVPDEAVFAGIEDVDPRSVLGSGDVKYHIGATGRYKTREGETLEIHLATNPSHLEAVNPVIMGRIRARQERWGKDGWERMFPITMHGDAAFAGQGITSETINLSHIPEYSVGGTIQVIVNNLIGFTAEPRALHPGHFSSDAGRRLSIPVIHVNGEDPNAIWWAGCLAAEYRYRFRSDVVVDIIGFRRYGHSEIEDPTTTQPVLYDRIRKRPTLHDIYGERIAADPSAIEAMRKRVMDGLAQGQEQGRIQSRRPVFFQLPEFWGRYHGGLYDPAYELPTALAPERVSELAVRLTEVPKGFKLHSKMEKFLSLRGEMFAGKRAADWGAAEALAIGSMLWDGTPVRISGQDSRRGTFNHRNAALIDIETGESWLPLAHLHDRQGRMACIDSPLSEAAVMGFEYGYSRETPDGLVCWEAQFGDFANGAQVIIDQFISAAEDKWRLLSGLVLLLPHGYEGQGPEHSSARIERFLQLAAQDNLQVCQPSTAAQYFHLLRRQVIRAWRKPLIVIMPKSILRLESACSDISEITGGSFQTVVPDAEVKDARVVLLCCGKIAHELRAERARRGVTDRAIITIEQFYPFPGEALAAELARHPGANKIIWVQEEPANMGALSFLRQQIRPFVGDRHLTSIKRYESASPATGSAKAHVLEQQALIKLAFA